MPDWFSQNVFVKRSSEVALEKFVVIDRLGNDAPDKLEVAKMVGVDVTAVVDGVGDSVSRTGFV